MIEKQTAENSEEKPLDSLLENNEVLARRYTKILEARAGAVYTEKREAYLGYQKASDKLESARTKIINTYYLKEWDEYNWLKKEESEAYEKFKQSGSIHDSPEGQEWNKKFDLEREASGIKGKIDYTLQQKFPQLQQEVDEKQKLWEKAYREEQEFFSASDYDNARQKSLEAYDEARGKKYEGQVNAFLHTIRDYQQRKNDRLNTKLIDGLRKIGNSIAISAGQNRIKKFIEGMNSIAERAGWQVIRQTAWAVSAISLCFAMNKAAETKIQDYIAGDLDKMYEYVSNSPHDSVTNSIFHSIAGDDTMSAQWRTFLAHEDSTEFSSEEDRQSYITSLDKDGNPIPYEEPTMDEKLTYLALWKMNEAHGKPKAEYGQHKGDHDRASYSGHSNTMHLPTYAGKFIISDYIAELSHAEQYGKDYARYKAWHDRDFHTTDSAAKVMNVSYHDAQLKMYGDPNTLEYEAHSIIEPKLEEEIKKKKQEIVGEILKHNKNQY